METYIEEIQPPGTSVFLHLFRGQYKFPSSSSPYCTELRSISRGDPATLSANPRCRTAHRNPVQALLPWTNQESDECEPESRWRFR